MSTIAVSLKEISVKGYNKNQYVRDGGFADFWDAANAGL